MQIEDYPALLASLDHPTLLLGNGFSIACDRRYGYQALKKNVKLPSISKDLLERLGTPNIEQAMQILEDTLWVAEKMKCRPCRQLKKDYSDTRHAMAKAIAKDHLKTPNDIDADQSGRCQAAGNFLRAYRRIFTTNYDLLLYWILMREMTSKEDTRLRLDGMPRDEGKDFGWFDAAREINVLYLHGALHIYAHGDETRKLIRKKDQSLVEMIDEIFKKGDEPLFVAAGRAEQKLRAIEDNAYLKYCFDEFSNIEGDLVIYGLSLGVGDAMATNKDLRSVSLGLYGDPDSASNLTLRAVARRLQDTADKTLKIRFFDSKSAAVWDPVPPPAPAPSLGSSP